MDALSPSFISALPKQSLIFSPRNHSHYSPLLISSVRIEDKPTQSSTNSRQLPKPIQPPPSQPRQSSPKSPPASPRRPEITIPATILAAVDDLINTFIDPPGRPSVDPRHVLIGNFAPVDEIPPTKCQIVGRLPACLDGAYIRNGPNPQFLPRGPYHLFDGDGMLHCLRVSRGGANATLSSRYVRTNKFKTERQVGTQVVPNVFSAFNGLTASAARGALVAARVVTGQLNVLEGVGLANTSLARIAGRLFALGESDLPYEVAVTGDGDIATLGRSDLNGQLLVSMTAHPKLDPVTGETFAFRYGPVPPFLTYFRFDASGKKAGPDVPVSSMTRPSFLHDFAVTEKYAVFNDIQIGMDPAGLVLRGGSPVGSDSTKVPRIGVMPRYATDESGIRWFDVPGFNLIHAINAWDEVDHVTGSESIVLVAPNIMSVEHTLERLELVHAQVEKVRINLETGHVSRVPVSARNLDFAVINPKRVGRKNRFVYAAVGDPMPKISGVVKLDLEIDGKKECTVAERMFGHGCYGGEPFFVARDPEDEEAEEDDGYLVSYLHDENTGESKFVVFDAKSPDLEVVAEVRLPQRVPYGFHGIFVREKDLGNMRPAALYE